MWLLALSLPIFKSCPGKKLPSLYPMQVNLQLNKASSKFSQDSLIKLLVALLCPQSHTGQLEKKTCPRTSRFLSHCAKRSDGNVFGSGRKIIMILQLLSIGSACLLPIITLKPCASSAN
jgi:hypothetical protein